MACGEDEYSPKPRGYFRLAVPEKTYDNLDKGLPYSFEINKNAQWVAKQFFWGDVYYPDIKARLQLTYKEVKEDNLSILLGEGRDLAYKHVVRADGISDEILNFPDSKVHGMMYRIQGDAATSTQFFVTDSVNHYLRGVLYFYASPNSDSLQPVNDFMYEETMHIIETLKWQNS